MLDFANLKITSPKRNPRAQTGWEGFFPYYAGYPEAFAHELLSSAGLSKSSRVLDPWNGSGTTTFAASKLMLDSVGVDINPVMVIVARARTLPVSEADSLVALAKQLVIKAEQEMASFESSDPLGHWFGPSTSSWLRSVERAISGSLTSDQTRAKGEVQSVSAIAATYYVALFALCRELTSIYKTTNPTWLKVAKSGERRGSANRKWLSRRFIELIAEMAEALSSRNADVAEFGQVELIVADTASGLVLEEQVDFILTSPPYCTRIDYTAATRIQLAILSPMLKIGKAELSLQMLGSVRVPKRNVIPAKEWGSTCNIFLEMVKKHPSKASDGYYLKTHIDYFDKMFRSLSAISKAMRPKGAAILVVQDSYYKEVHNDLPAVVSEMASVHGLELRRRENYRISKTLAGSHPHTKKYRRNFEATESVLCFERV